MAQVELKMNGLGSYDLKRNLEDYLVFDSYPEALEAKTREEKRGILIEIVGSYLLKDILEIEKMRKHG